MIMKYPKQTNRSFISLLVWKGESWENLASLTVKVPLWITWWGLYGNPCRMQEWATNCQADRKSEGLRICSLFWGHSPSAPEDFLQSPASYNSPSPNPYLENTFPKYEPWWEKGTDHIQTTTYLSLELSPKAETPRNRTSWWWVLQVLKSNGLDIISSIIHQ